MSDRKYTMLHLCDIYEAERKAMRGTMELAALSSSEDYNTAVSNALQRQIGIKILMDDIEAMVDEKEKDSEGG